MSYLLCLIPVLAAFIVVAKTRRPFESVILGLVVGVVIYGISIGDFNFAPLFVSILSEEMADSGTVWVIVFTLLIGIFVEIIDAAKGTAAVSALVGKHANSEKKTLLSVLAMGILVFPDEFLKGVVLCSYSKDIGRKSRVSLESISICIVALCIPLCVLMPFTTWSTYFAQLLSTFGISTNYTADYITKVTPMLFFPIALMVILVLFVLGILPKLGPARKAAQEISSSSYDFPAVYGAAPVQTAQTHDKTGQRTATVLDFAVPLVILLVTSFFYGGDLVVSLCVTLAVMLVWYLVRKILTFSEFMDAFFRGMNSMLKPTVYLVLGFAMTGLVGKIGFPELVNVVTSWMMPAIFLPFVFITAALFGMVTGMMWPTTTLFLTACLPMVETIGISPFMLAATLFSSAALASVLSPRGALIMTISQELNTDVVHEMNTIRPYTLIAAGISVIAYLILGFLI